jgi:hypothetical protein
VTDQRESTDQLDLFRQPTEVKPTHGRHCPCSACAREDWTKIEAPCGMHGADCPRVYQLTKLPGETFEDIFGDAA